MTFATTAPAYANGISITLNAREKNVRHVGAGSGISQIGAAPRLEQNPCAVG